MANTDTPDVGKKLNFWDKPEGLWGMCIIGVLGAGTLWALSIIVPFLLTLGLGLLGLGLVVLLLGGLGSLVFTNNPMRQAILLKIQLVSRKMRSAVINEDPIAFLRLLQVKAKKRLEEFVEFRNEVAASRRKIMETLTSFEQDLENARARYNVFEKEGDKDGMQTMLVRAGKIDSRVDRNRKNLEHITEMQAKLALAEKKTRSALEEADFEIDAEERDRKSSESMNKAWKKWRSIFRLSADEDDQRREALRTLSDDLSRRMGEVDLIVDDFNEYLKAVNTDDAVAAEKMRMKMAVLENTPAPTLKSTFPGPAYGKSYITEANPSQQKGK